MSYYEPTQNDLGALRAIVEEEFEEQIDPRRWRRFLNDYPAAAEIADDPIAVAYAWRGWSARSNGHGRRVGDSSGEEQADPRLWALTEIVAHEARRWDPVVQYRKEILGGQFIDTEEIPAWIEAVAEEDGPPTRWVSVPEGDDGEPLSMAEARGFGFSRSIRLLGYSIPGDPDRHYKPIAAGGRLSRLKRIVDLLSERFGWPEPWAVIFVLSDTTPPVSPPFSYSYNLHPEWPLLEKVTLEVSPRKAPEEVAAHWRTIRNEILGGGEKQDKRIRSLSEKAAALAVHWATAEGTGIQELRQRWNGLHPEWAYPDRRGNFSRDSRDAYTKVTGRPAPSRRADR